MGKINYLLPLLRKELGSAKSSDSLFYFSRSTDRRGREERGVAERGEGGGQVAARSGLAEARP